MLYYVQSFLYLIYVNQARNSVDSQKNYLLYACMCCCFAKELFLEKKKLKKQRKREGLKLILSSRRVKKAQTRQNRSRRKETDSKKSAVKGGNKFDWTEFVKNHYFYQSR